MSSDSREQRALEAFMLAAFQLPAEDIPELRPERLAQYTAGVRAVLALADGGEGEVS